MAGERLTAAFPAGDELHRGKAGGPGLRAPGASFGELVVPAVRA